LILFIQGLKHFLWQVASFRLRFILKDKFVPKNEVGYYLL